MLKNSDITVPEELVGRIYEVVKEISVTLAPYDRNMREVVVALILEILRPEQADKTEYFKYTHETISEMLLNLHQDAEKQVVKNIAELQTELQYDALLESDRFSTAKTPTDTAMYLATFITVQSIYVSVVMQYPMATALFTLTLPFYLSVIGLVSSEIIYKLSVDTIKDKHVTEMVKLSNAWTLNMIAGKVYNDLQAEKTSDKYYGFD